MEYNTPELVVLGTASALVLGDFKGSDDNLGSEYTHPSLGFALGLDD